MGEEAHLVPLDHPVDLVAIVTPYREGVIATAIRVLTQISKIISLIPQVGRGITREYIRTTVARELIVEEPREARE